jgi:predicted enzyme related to lactoylglutathione lyase
MPVVPKNLLYMNTTKLFKNVAFTASPVADVKKSWSFYEDVLGLTVTANWNDQWVEYDVGEGTLVIVAADEKHQAGANGTFIGLEVVDFDAVLAHLRQKSVAISDGPFDSPVCRGCAIRDPDGNEILIHAKK